jgi:putative hemolysin
MKRLVQPGELAKASHMRPGDPRIALLTEMSGLKRLERFYNEIEDLHDLEFTSAVFRNLELELEVTEEDLAQVPHEGGLVFVANHPYGAIDGLALVNVLGRVRPDLKVMANFLLQQLEPLRERFIGVNPFEQLGSRSSFQGMRQALAHVKEGHALAVFPAGEVSSWRTELKAVADPRWKTPAIKLLQHAEAPVVPVWFDGANSLVFQMLGMIHPNLRTLALPNEMLRMRGRTVRMRIGKPIPAKEIAAFSSADQLTRFLRAKTYALGSGVPVKREFFNPLRFPRRPKEVVEAVPEATLLAEVERIVDLRMNSQAEFDLYLAPSHRIPNLLREIGRLREVTFRAVGEGTNKTVDLDEFDLYYDHLFLWDKEKKRLVGAYRIGDGRRIMARYGKRGFYTSTLFRMDRPMERVLRRSFELGRSFIAPEYQRQRLPLFMLWRGLLMQLVANPEHNFLIGPVSISGTYSRFSRALIMEFVRQHHYDEALAANVHPRNRFRVKFDKADSEALVEASMADLKKMDRLIAEFDPKENAMPVLLKKYLLLNARIIGFNRDPRFNDALDGLMVLDLNNVPAKTVEDLRKGMSEE